MSNLAFIPIHYASVSGGKDSLYMLKVIASNPKKYPLDMIVHFSLEIDYPWVKKSIMAAEMIADKMGVMFKVIKPRKSFDELYKKYGFPKRTARWCNNLYKLDCKKQLHDWIKSQKCRPVAYIGFCSDEVKRFKYNVGSWNPEENQDVCYPLAEEGITEDSIRFWANYEFPVFDDYYKVFKRQGCMMCPNSSMLELAYVKLVHTGAFVHFGKMVLETEKKFGKVYNHEWEKLNVILDKKWVPKLKEILDRGI